MKNLCIATTGQVPTGYCNYVFDNGIDCKFFKGNNKWLCEHCIDSFTKKCICKEAVQEAKLLFKMREEL